MQVVYSSVLKSKKQGKKQFAVLVDPDKFDPKVIDMAKNAKVDFILVGGSILTSGNFEDCIQKIKKQTSIPLVIFPGNNLQISKNADAILLLSLISGRNPELLIGKHVVAAPVIKSSKLEVIPTGYMLIDSGKQTAALYISNTHPIPHDKDDIAMCTAMAGEMLGLKLIYLDAGSGAEKPVSASMIKKISLNTFIPIIAGGGIDTPAKALIACKAGADVIVVGNAIEKDNKLIRSISNVIHNFK